MATGGRMAIWQSTAIYCAVALLVACSQTGTAAAWPSKDDGETDGGGRTLGSTLGAIPALFKPGYKDCNGDWSDGCETNVKTNVMNCGDCGVECPEYPYTTARCNEGECCNDCNEGYKDCNADKEADGCEVNVQTDVNNCGDCRTVCPVHPYSIAKCNNGQCESTCKPWWGDCNGNQEDGCEVDLGKDVQNCGGCGKNCPVYPYSSPTCEKGVCTNVCSPGWQDCNAKPEDGCEVDIRNDAQNCGECGKKCPPGFQCKNGKCTSVCKPGYKDCNKGEDGCQVNVQTDSNNCGDCGKKCPVYPYSIAKCSGGKCSSTCKPWWANCNKNAKDGCEVDLGQDVHNCGACGKKCSHPSDSNAQSACRRGVCGEQCKSGFKYNSQKKCVAPSNGY